MRRREFTGLAALALLGGCMTTQREVFDVEEMYGLISQMIVADGRRGEVIAALMAGSANLPGNVAYLVAEDLDDPNAIWITEVWNTKTDHANSLKQPSVQAAIAAARPYITGFGARAQTRPV